MTFTEAKEEIIRDGYQEGRIHQMKCWLSDEEVCSVWEESKDVPAPRGEGESFAGSPKIFRYKLGEGSIDPTKKQFWIPCVFDRYKGWVPYYCAPSWLETREERDKFCSKFYKEESWPDEKEASLNPIRYVKGELSVLRNAKQFEGSPEIPKESQDKARQEIARLGDLAFDYLARAIELSLAVNEPKHKQVTREKMKDGETMSRSCQKTPIKIIELAYRAGKLSERFALHYRGIPEIAESGESMVRARRSSNTGSKLGWTKAAEGILSENLGMKPRKMAIELQERGVLFTLDDWANVSFEDGTPDKTWKAFSTAVGRIRNRLKNEP